MKTLIIMIILISFCIFLMSAIVPLYYSRTRDLKPEYFRKIKIRIFTKLFIGYGNKDSIYRDVAKYGVIFPIFILHILGYSLSILSIIAFFTMYFAFKINIVTIAITIACTLAIESIILIVTDLTCSLISKKKDEEKNKY